MPTPEEEAQFMQWMGTVNPQAMFSGQNIQGAAAAQATPEAIARAKRRSTLGGGSSAPASFGSPEEEDAYWAQQEDQLTAFTQSPAGQEQARRAGLADERQQEQWALDAMSPEERARYQQNQANDQRYGNDLSWLDPSLRYDANLLGQSAGSTAAADPNAINAQNAAMTRAQELSNTNLQFQSPDQQQALSQQWAGIQGGQGAPTFMGGGTQEQMMKQLLGVQAPRYSGDADQRGVMNQAMGFSANTGPGSLAFDTSGRQGEQYGNLQGIIAGGGATAIEMADRARQRGDSESWLRGQREADMADYAERGLTGSGMELLALSGDRQAAAGRNSLADLETAKALEERRLGAINSAAGLATNIRGQTTDEQSLLNNRSMTGINAATSVVNSMRDADIREQNFLNESARDQAQQAAGIAEASRTQGYNESTYLDKRSLDALKQRTDIADKTRDQTYQEQIGNRNAIQSAVDTLSNTSGDARRSSAQESQYRATSADDFSVKNQDAINKAASENAAALQRGNETMQNNRVQWAINELNQQVNAATNLTAGDAAENTAGFTQGQQLGAADTTWFNNLSQEQRNALMANFQGGQAGQAAANQAGNAANADIYGGIAGTAGMAGQMVASAYTGGAAGAAGSAAANAAPAAPATNLSQPTGGGGTNTYGVGVGGSSQPANYGVSVNGLTQAGGGAPTTSAALPRNIDWDKLKQQTR